MVLQNFLERPMTYRAGALVGFFFGIVLIVGVACPFWYVSEDGAIFGGMWSYCHSDTDLCVGLTFGSAEGWWLALQILEPLAAVCVALSCSCLLFENCFHGVSAPRLMQETLGILGGILGTIGSFIFVGKTASSSNTRYSTYSWSFYFTIISSIVVFVSTLVILIGGKTSTKSFRVNDGDGEVASQASLPTAHWAEPSPAIPRRLLAAPMSGDFSSFPPATPPGTPKSSAKSVGVPTPPGTPNLLAKPGNASTPPASPMLLAKHGNVCTPPLTPKSSARSVGISTPPGTPKTPAKNVVTPAEAPQITIQSADAFAPSPDDSNLV